MSNTIDFKGILSRYGFDEKKIKNLAKNEELAITMAQTLEAKAGETLDNNIQQLIYSLYSTKSDIYRKHDSLFVDYIFAGKLITKHQLKLAEDYLADKDTVDQDKFSEYCGVGVSLSEEQITEYIKDFLAKNKDLVAECSGKISHPQLLTPLKEGLRLAEPTLLIKLGGSIIKDVCSELPVQDKPKKEKKSKKDIVKTEEETQSMAEKIDLSSLIARDVAASHNSQKHIDAQREATGGKIVTRFPPEPNGILHVGHARSIRFNFSVAGNYEGDCILRFDDTNPAKETLEFINEIKENVSWMGFTPSRVTFASDNYGRIYDLTLKLINMGKAYVCFLNRAEAKEFRDSLKPSPYREQTIEQTHEYFEKMKSGYYKEGEAVLRARIQADHIDPLMRDPVLYRIMYTPHPVTASEWCIYPMYDYTHPLCDSFEWITHSCCTLEFEKRRDLYYWPLETLDLYKPFVWEFSRLNLTKTMTSKRKILVLIEEKVVDGWDDPRLFTIAGLRRRGIPVGAINDFLDRVPPKRTGNDNFTQLALLNNILKKYIDYRWPRCLAVVDPVKLTITDLPADHSENVEVPFNPAEPNSGSYTATEGREIYVEFDDVSLVEKKGFLKIFPGNQIRLKYSKVLHITDVKQEGGKLEVFATTQLPESVNLKKVKVLNWLSLRDAKEVETRLYEDLFTVDVVPTEGPELQNCINHNSKTIKKSYINKAVFDNLSKSGSFQFERQGYFALDQDTDLTQGKVVFNRVLDQGTYKLE